MAKPIVTSFSAIAPLIIQQYERYLPSAFDENLSILQKMNKIMQYLNEIGQLSTDVITQWNEVMEWVMGEGLTDAVSIKLDEFLANGTLDAILGRTILGKKLVSIAMYPRITPETTDSPRIQRAINEVEDGTTIVFADADYYDISTTLTNIIDVNTKRNVSFLSYKAEFRTIQNGLDMILRISDITDFSISGIKFNQNYKGRTTLEINDCERFVIEDCSFTGYSADYGHYATDSAIRVNGSSDFTITKNKWFLHGNQYSTGIDTLNRCITIQASCDNFIITENNFNQVNQAIIISDGKGIVSNNIFTNIRDNVLYQVGTGTNIVFTGNQIDHKYDEAVVVDTGTIIVSDNKFKNVPNKVLAIGGNVDKVLFTGNMCDNTEITKGQFIMWRATTNRVGYMLVADNVFKNTSIENTFEYFNIGNVGNFVWRNNDVEVSTSANQRILWFTGTEAKGVIEGGSFVGTESTSLAYEVESTVVSPDVLVKDVEILGCRGKLLRTKAQGQLVQFNTSTPYVNNKMKMNQLFSSEIPNNGDWNAGAYVVNTVPTLLGLVGGKYYIKGWLRLTTGSANVDGTDWIIDKLFTGA